MFKREFTPAARGFNVSVGYLQGCESAWTHVAACCGAHTPTADQGYVCDAPKGKDYRGYDWFDNGTPDLSANGTNSAELIRAAATRFYAARPASSTPTFVYLAAQNIHAPYTCEARYRQQYAADPSMTEAEKTMFGYLTELDDVVGDVVAAMKAAGRYDHSLIIFSSDNGAPPAHDVRGRNWPFRGHKSQIWEGGTRVAGFVHAPSLLPASVRGTRSRELYHVTDWLPTIVGVAGGTVPSALSGYNIFPSLAGGGPSPRHEMLYNINPLCDGGQAGPPKAGIREGRWKLLAYCYSIAGIAGGTTTGPIAPAGGLPKDWPGGNDTVVLFDLEADPGETTSVAAHHPDVVARLTARLAAHAAASVEPMQWDPPFQGPDYQCASCPLRPAVASPFDAWTPWMDPAPGRIDT
jgi:arylsulfatase A-like enzyme